MNSEQMNLLDRFYAPTPSFFKKLRNVGIIVTAASTAILTAPVVLPGILITVAGYLLVAGSIVSAVSQVTVEGE